MKVSGREVRFEEVEHADRKHRHRAEAAQDPSSTQVARVLNPLFWMPTKSCVWKLTSSRRVLRGWGKARSGLNDEAPVSNQNLLMQR